ncbi:MAG: hypothetical protein WBY44_19660 [Bryobacteraceae bacterium]|jgi:hypothetical protein
MSDWLELELADRLAPVRAPEALWARVNKPAPSTVGLRKSRPGAWGWFAAAAMATATLAVTVAIPSPSLSQLAAAELAKSLPADFQSGNPKEIAKWLRANAAVDLAIPPGTAVQLTGARAIERGGTRIGEVLYRVAGRDAVLLVKRAGSLEAPTRHGQSVWQAHGQVYALAFTEPLQPNLACRLCHID